MTSLATPKSSAALLAAAILACSCSDDSPAPAPSTTSDGGAGGAPPDSSCPAGELVLPDGTCQPVGIPEGSCGEGFLPDGNMGCEPILPPSLCPPGQMAVPGDETCRAVSACADGTWGDIPVGATTQYVDASYSGGNSDGSEARPWTTIQPAVEAAVDDAIIAIAAGTYAEDVIVFDKGVKLWGRCPELVTIEGSAGALSAVSFYGGGSELHGVAVTAGGAAVLVAEAESVVVDTSWIHDTGSRGVVLMAGDQGLNATVSHTLIEGATEAGIATEAVTLQVTRSNIRGTRRNASGELGVGVVVHGSDQGRASVEIEGSLIEDSCSRGVWLRHADATVSATVVRRTQPTALGQAGWAMVTEGLGATSPPATLSLTTSVLEDSVETGLVIWVAEATVAHTVIRNTQPSAEGLYGWGISVEADLFSGARSTLELSDSTVYGHQEVGLFVGGSDATVTRTRISESTPNTDGAFGDGIAIGSMREGPERATLALQEVWLGDNLRAGMSSFGAVTTVQRCTLWCNAIDLDGENSYLSWDIPFDFEDQGENVCGCGEEQRECQVLTTGLQAPTPPGP